MTKIPLHQKKKQDLEGDPKRGQVTETEDLRHQEGSLLLQEGDQKHLLQEELGAQKEVKKNIVKEQNR